MPPRSPAFRSPTSSAVRHAVRCSAELDGGGVTLENVACCSTLGHASARCWLECIRLPSLWYVVLTCSDCGVGCVAVHHHQKAAGLCTPCTLDGRCSLCQSFCQCLAWDDVATVQPPQVQLSARLCTSTRYNCSQRMASVSELDRLPQLTQHNAVLRAINSRTTYYVLYSSGVLTVERGT